MIGRNCLNFYKYYCVWDKLHIHCFLKSDSFFFKESTIVRQPVSCTWPPVWWSVDFVPWAGSPAISLNTGHQMTCLCTGKIMTATKKRGKKLFPTNMNCTIDFTVRITHLYQIFCLFKNGTKIILYLIFSVTYLVNPSREASAFSLSETTKLSQSHRHWYTQADKARLRFLMVNTVFMWLPIPGGRVISITVWRRSWVIHWMCLMGSATTVLELAMLADNRGRVVGKGRGDNSCCWGFSCWCSYN